MISTVSAQTTDNSTSPACKQCLIKSRIAQVPSCEGVVGSYSGSNNRDAKMTEKERSCHCGSADSDAWIAACNKPDLCANATVFVLRAAYGPIKAACTLSGYSSSASASATSDGGVSLLSSSRLSTSKGVAVAGVTIAAAFALGSIL
ncbi:hypothetical protein BGX29_008444 [Mortierella sp. GBA35]|nr:hypothetical protein BGX29_008444 [Mortierella sp. GBA35]